MKRWLFLFFALAFFSARAEDAPALDALLYDATRYANTPERKEAKRIAREKLKAHMPKAFDAAMRYIEGDNVSLQVLVMEWVQELPTETIAPAILKYLDDPREEVRRLAAFFLGFHPTPEYADKLFPLLENAETRGAALRTLGKWKIPGAREPAEKMLAEANERQRVVAANALRDLGDPAALPALLAALDDPVFTVRHTAARALVSLAPDPATLRAWVGRENRERSKRLIERIIADMHDADETASETAAIAVDGKFFLP